MAVTINGTSGITTPGITNTGNETVAGNETVTGDITGSSFNGGQLAGQRNKIINGAMMIDQRNAGALLSSANGYITDRWTGGWYAPSGGSYSGQQVTDAPVGFSNSLKLTVTATPSTNAGDAYFQLIQNIEGYNATDLSFGVANAKAVTISFWVKSSISGLFSLTLFNNVSPAYSYVTTYTINVANTWEYKTVTIPGATSGTWGTVNSYGISLVFDLGSGTNQEAPSANTWAAGNYRRIAGTNRLVNTNGATFYITGVQLEKGATATPFENRLYGTELALCQRYYQIENGANGYAQIGSTAWVRTGNTFVANQKHTVPMRATPTGGSLGAWYAGDSSAVNQQIGTASITVGGNSAYSSTLNWTGIGAGTFNAGGATSPNSGPSNTGGYYLSAEL